MTVLDIDFVRSNFPAFSEPSLEGWGFFESAGGSYACAQTINWLQRYYTQTKVQPYFDFPSSESAGEQMDSAKRRLAAWLNVETAEVHFGPSTSQNTYVLAQALRRDEAHEHRSVVGVSRRIHGHHVLVHRQLTSVLLDEGVGLESHSRVGPQGLRPHDVKSVTPFRRHCEST